MVREAIQSLEERQRLALMLSKFEGMSYAEIAATIVRGFLNVDIMGLPAPLKKAMDDQISLLEAGNAM